MEKLKHRPTGSTPCSDPHPQGRRLMEAVVANVKTALSTGVCRGVGMGSFGAGPGVHPIGGGIYY